MSVPLLTGALVVLAPPAPAGASVATILRSSSPAFNNDAPDPDVVRSGSTYYAFTTGNVHGGGNNIQALRDTSGSPATGWTQFGSALPHPPSWETTSTQNAPGVFFWGGRWIMYYAATSGGASIDTGHGCLAMATASTAAFPVFTDTSAGAFYCQPSYGGSIDPSPFVDTSTGRAYLTWKSNSGVAGIPSYVWVAQLNATGTGFVTAPRAVLFNDTADHPWETTLDDPSMLRSGNAWYLMFSAGYWQSGSYDEGMAVCSSPVGPCSQPQYGPILTSYPNAVGPGGGSLFTDASGQDWVTYAAWSPGCSNYGCNGSRRMFVAPIVLGNVPYHVPCSPPAVHTGYRMVASDGGIFSLGHLPFCGSTGNMQLKKPIVGMADTPDGGGYWLVASDGGIFSFGDAAYHGSEGGKPLAKPIVGMAPTPDGKGYWLVASDGGVFTFGDAHSYGSEGGKPLAKPIVGMAPTPDGKGYWLVASDGGIFRFGDAGWYGSQGATHLAKPIVGMAATPDGKGYWLVASDGGIFRHGDAAWYGSEGATHLNAPIVGMAATRDGKGYWLVAADGGIFKFGAAGWFGSEGATHLARPIVGMGI